MLKDDNNLICYQMYAIKNDWCLEYFRNTYSFPHFTLFRADSKKPVLFESDKDSEYVTISDILQFLQENSFHSFDLTKYANEAKQFDDVETQRLEMLTAASVMNRKVFSIQDIIPDYRHPVSEKIQEIFDLVDLDHLELTILTEKFNEFKSIPTNDLEEMLSKIIEGKSMTITLQPTDETLDIVKSHPKVILDFSTTWCGPCEYVAPFFGQLSLENDNIVFVKVICDDNKTVLQNYNVENFPTFQTYVNGDLFEKSVGANPEKLKGLVFSLGEYKLD